MYITIYISISYIIYKEELSSQFSNWNWNNGTLRSRNLNSKLLLYQAILCPEQFVGHARGKLLYSEAQAHPDGAEVGAQRVASARKTKASPAETVEPAGLSIVKKLFTDYKV